MPTRGRKEPEESQGRINPQMHSEIDQELLGMEARGLVESPAGLEVEEGDPLVLLVPNHYRRGAEQEYRQHQIEPRPLELPPVPGSQAEDEQNGDQLDCVGVFG